MIYCNTIKMQFHISHFDKRPIKTQDNHQDPAKLETHLHVRRNFSFDFVCRQAIKSILSTQQHYGQHLCAENINRITQE